MMYDVLGYVDEGTFELGRGDNFAATDCALLRGLNRWAVALPVVTQPALLESVPREAAPQV